ncbi:multidrug effflux MFS transporter [Sutterella faecalis]|uniref:Multidrug effflux MFS transporter n=3 Tax=Sutterellaceae TaxID=995019 RepID=A0AAI9SDU8_9BURK|nr:multidrug effflux MFS transporter [Sutterella seckii]QDA54293.1 multidrug effflux MFS transporter [Sutterella faecalis]
MHFPMTQSDLKSPPKLTDGMLLAAVATLGPFAANTYVPAFGDIERDFGVSAIAVQQSLSLYLLAFACASLLIGALSDAFGRRRVLIAATLIFALASIGCMFSTSIEVLYGWRFLMGLCASAGPVISQAIVRVRGTGDFSGHCARPLAGG